MPRNLLIFCAVTMAAYGVLFQMMARTHLIEKVMAASFVSWELLAIVIFLALRIATYLIVPSVLVALTVHALARRLAGSK